MAINWGLMQGVGENLGSALGSLGDLAGISSKARAIAQFNDLAAGKPYQADPGLLGTVKNLFGGGQPQQPAQPVPQQPGGFTLGSIGQAPASGGHISQTTSTNLAPNQRALLDTIAGTESPDYNTIYGGRKVDDLSAHPNIAVPIPTGPNAGKTSSAAGRYQFLGSTWNDEAQKLGLKDFSPQSQDMAAWNLAATTYQQKTGRDLSTDLNDPNARGQIGAALSGIWTSLPGGIEAGTNQNRFAQAYDKNLRQYANAGADSPLAAPGLAGVQVASNDASFAPQMPAAQPSPNDVTGSAGSAPATMPAAASPAPGGNNALPFAQVPLASLIQLAGNNSLPDAQRAVLGQIIQARMPQAKQYGFMQGADGTIFRTNPQTGAIEPAAQSQMKPTSDMQEYQAAKQQGFKGSLQDWIMGTKNGGASKFGFMQSPDGTIFRTNPLTGAIEPAAQGGQKPLNPTSDMQEYNAAKAQGYQGTLQDWIVGNKKAGATAISIDNTGENSFSKELGTGSAKIFNGLLEGGTAAQADLANIGVLRDALAKSPTGLIGGIQSLAQDWGLNIGKNADAVQVAKAAIAKLVPAQRVPGSGTTSDRDLAMFQSALPKLTGTPQGNAIILDTMQAMAEYKQAQADIAGRLATGEFKTPTDPTGMKGAIAALRALPSPYEGFKKQAGAVLGNSGGTTSAPPPVGTIDGGYVFRGGDPADPNNWTKAQ